MRLLPWLPRPKRRDLTMSNTLQYRDDPRAYRPVSGAFVAVAREPKWVELRGLEPLTPTLPVWCATSCATAPCGPVWWVQAVSHCTARAPADEVRGGGAQRAATPEDRGLSPASAGRCAGGCRRDRAGRSRCHSRGLPAPPRSP